MKSERLKKLETELEDLEQWLKLSLVPKKDLDKHKEEIRLIKEKIKEEKERLRFLKESGDMEEYIAPKRTPARQPYSEPQTLPDMDIETENEEDIGMEMDAMPFARETEEGDDVTFIEEDEEDDPFSDKNRWKRGILEDPDIDNW